MSIGDRVLHAMIDAMLSMPRKWVAADASRDRGLRLTVEGFPRMRIPDGAEPATVVQQVYRRP